MDTMTWLMGKIMKNNDETCCRHHNHGLATQLFKKKNKNHIYIETYFIPILEEHLFQM